MRWIGVTKTGFLGAFVIGAAAFAAFGFVVSRATAASTATDIASFQTEAHERDDADRQIASPASARVQISDFQGRITLKLADVDTVSINDPQAEERTEQAYVTRLRDGDNGVTFSMAGRAPLTDDDLRDFYRYQRDNRGESGNEILRSYLADAPAVTLTVPMGADIAIERSIAIVGMADPGTENAGSEQLKLGHVKLGRGVIGATLGDLASGNITVGGIADVAIGNVDGALKGALSGSANFRAGTLGEARLVLSGSGNIDTDDIKGHGDLILSGSGNLTVGAIAAAPGKSTGKSTEETSMVLTGSGNITARDVGQPVSARITGSGNITARNVGQPVSARITGSGNIGLDNVDGDISTQISGSGQIRARAIAGGATVRISGSGDLDIDRVDGIVDVSIGGNGRVRIDDGRAHDLKVSIAGNGHFTHRGIATNLNASISGNGSIKVARNEGTLKTSNRDGIIEVNGQRIKPKRR
ncbi:MAG: DUF2807 domain-containing protein [Pseudomonadota bacterium]